MDKEADKILSKNHGNRTYIRRWYDEDPELLAIVSKMEYSTDEVRNKVAMLIIKVIIDRNILQSRYNDIDALVESVRAGYTDTRRSRWYDTSSTTRTAMQMLRDLPGDERYSVAQEIKQSHKYICIFPI